MKKHVQKNQNLLLLNDVTSYDVIEICQKMTPKTSSDALGFQQNIILSDMKIMAPVIAHLVNKSQSHGIFPENGKIARVGVLRNKKYILGALNSNFEIGRYHNKNNNKIFIVTI